MIQFSLKCDRDHRFDSWFQSSEAFEKLQGASMITCAICGSAHVDKAPMAPRVQTSRGDDAAPGSNPLQTEAAQLQAEQAMAEMRRKVEATADYVGKDFARQAREIHDGAKPGRAIYGEARPEEARALLEDGVPVLPLPFTPRRKTN
ncbi:DUF1178 family protein [Pseudooceanicola algae]|uniref:DUF1178 family protein n=1 Tax=Pseudooceanicola algae TaxID=1537215 RepID=A0A418SIN5_9RHOB|nr:DUF1178 family protein [Pseudooceanicola algae]QPM88968.1 hypothetical protein PSAL_001710 [Pseudooceanicola algae]